MPFQTFPINITGPTYQSRSRPLSSQQTINFYHQFNESGKEQYVLLPFPGLDTIGNAVGIDRGFNRMAEVAFQVKGNTLYSIDSSGVHTEKGTIPGTERCIIRNDGINMFIVSDLRVHQFDGSTVTEVTDPDITGAKSVDFINNQFLYTKDKFTTVSDVGNGANASGLNIIGEETNPDDLVRDYVFDQIIWRMSERTVVGWYNSGIGSPPITRIEGSIFNVGLAAIHSVAHTDESMFWLGDDKSIHTIRGRSKTVISTDAISNTINKFDRIDDAYAFTFNIEGQNFYAITFPSGNITLVVNENLGQNGWYELSSGTQGDKYQGTSLLNVYGKNFVADELNGNVYCLDLDEFKNNDEPLKRVRTTSSITGAILGSQHKGKRIQMSRLEIIMETGVGVIDGQGDDPRIIVEQSTDGGRSFKSGTFARTGRLGEFILRVEWFNLESFYDCILRVSTSDPVNYSIYSATIDLRLAGR